MKIEEAIARYLDACISQRLRTSTIETIRRRLQRVFEPVLSEELAILTAEQVHELRARLGRQGARGGLLLGSTRELHWRTSRAFLLWCVERRLLAIDPFSLRKVLHIGQVVRRLRDHAGLSRQDFAEQCGLSFLKLSRFETARANLGREELLRLLLHPSMESLPDKVKEAGLSLGLGNNGIGKS